MNRKTIFGALVLILATACNSTENQQDKPERELAKFEPKDGEVLLFVGQELDAIGGLEEYNDGYLDHFETPAGFTMYTDLTPGHVMFGFENVGLSGVYETHNWGDGDSNMSLQLADPDFEHMALAIGLWLVSQDDKVANGTNDEYIDKLGEFMLSLGERPVFLRIGYEFAGPWNGYDRENYLAAYKRIKDRLDEMGVENVAYVWQSKGFGLSLEDLEAWYPGDEYVDWMGYSFFSNWSQARMNDFARIKGKPVFIAEASPTITDTTSNIGGKTLETILSNPDQAQQAWHEWFTPFFDTVNENPDVVKAISYINAHWLSRPMWKENPTFQSIDARLHTSEFISRKWNEEISKDKYLKASPELFQYLKNPNQ